MSINIYFSGAGEGGGAGGGGAMTVAAPGQGNQGGGRMAVQPQQAGFNTARGGGGGGPDNRSLARQVRAADARAEIFREQSAVAERDFEQEIQNSNALRAELHEGDHQLNQLAADLGIELDGRSDRERLFDSIRTLATQREELADLDRRREELSDLNRRWEEAEMALTEVSADLNRRQDELAGFGRRWEEAAAEFATEREKAKKEVDDFITNTTNAHSNNVEVAWEKSTAEIAKYRASAMRAIDEARDSKAAEHAAALQARAAEFTAALEAKAANRFNRSTVLVLRLV